MAAIAINGIPAALLHVRFNGRSVDLPLAELDLGAAADDAQVREAVSSYLEISPAELQGYVVERHRTGNWTVRPEAVFG